MTAAAGSISIARAGLEQLLADSLTFQRSTNARDADAARRHVHFFELDQLLEDNGFLRRDQRPAAIVILESHYWRLIGQGTGYNMGAGGSLVAILTKNALPSEDPKEVIRDFENWLGCVLDEVSEKVGHNTYWPFTRIEIIEGPRRAEPNERASDDYWAAAVLFSHDIEGES